MIKNEIGARAGAIWEYMNKINKDCTLKELKKAASMKDRDLYLALGWLSRENKVQFYVKEETEYITLIQ